LILAKQFYERCTYQLQKFNFLFVVFGPLMVGHHLLEDAESFCLEEEPLSVEQLLDLLEVVEYSLI